MTASEKKFTAIGLVVFLVVGLAAAGFWQKDRVLKLLGKSSATNTAEAAGILREPKLPKLAKDATEDQKKLFDEAREKQKKRLNDPENYDLYLSEGLAWKSLGEYAVKAEDKRAFFEYAIFVYTQAGTKFDKEWIPWLNIGNLFRSLGDYQRAASAYQKSVETDPTQHDHYRAIVEMFKDLNISPSQSMMSFLNSNFTKMKVDMTSFVLLYAQYLLEHGMYQDALMIVRVGRDLNPFDQRLKLEYDDLEKELKKQGLIK
jgi:tetratricopeptide (TPR) repeat protein